MKTLLAVFAHPDDESFGPGGTLAKYAAEGVAVHLVCATRGEVGGSDVADFGACEDLARQREQELRCAASALGLAEVHLLAYRDSGMPGAPSNEHPQALARAETHVVAGQVADLVRRLRPQVLLTFDPYGTYGHPDHVAMHRATLAAFEHLRPTARPQKLYYTMIPRTFLRWAVRLMPLWGADPERVGKNRDINLREALSHALPITTKIDIRSVYEAKQRAGMCHSSQSSGSVISRLPRWLLRELQRNETFYRAVPAPRPGERLERDLFEGASEAVES